MRSWEGFLGERFWAEQPGALLRPRQLKPFPARLCLSLPFSSCEQRGEDVAKAAERRLPLRSSVLFGSDGLCRLDLADLASLPLVVGEELRQCFFDVRRRLHFGEPQRLGEPTGVLEQALGLLGHLALLEVVDELQGTLALRLTNRFENPRLGDAAEVVVDRRSPANLRHVEIDRTRQAVRLVEATLQAMGGHT